MKQMFDLQHLAAALLYSIAGVAIFWTSFVVVDRLTPYKLWEEIVAKQNRALAQVVGSIAIAIGIVVAAAILG